MKLPFALPFGKKENVQYFLALLLQDEKIGAVVLEESAGVLHVTGHAEEYFKTSLEDADFEELLETIDKAVSLAEESLPSGIQTQKTVFGVKQEWVHDGKITKDHLATLRRVCDELSFQPIGFLVFTEAILHRLQQEEGAPVSAIFVDLGKKIITISHVRAGRIVETQQVPLEIPLTHAVDKALKDFSAEILPSRIILFLSEKDSGVSHAFISHTWSKSLPFLHMPQITVLPLGFDTKSVLYGTAAQMNFTVSGTLPLPMKTSKPVKESKNIAQESEETDELEDEEENEEMMHETDAVEEEDPTEEELTSLDQPEATDFFGFVTEGDITSSKPKQVKKSIPVDDVDEAFAEIPEDVKEKTTNFHKADNFTTEASLLSSALKTPALSFLKNIPIENITEKLQDLLHALPIKKLPKNGLVLVIPAVLLVVLTGFLFYIFTVSADVTVLVNPKVLNDDRQVTFAIDSASDVSQNQLGVQTVSADEKDTVTEDTTGAKQVGTPAKGSVTIFNLSTTPATLSANTTLVSENGKKFTLDADVNVPAADPYSGTGGKATANVTASDIGPDYNLPSGTKFTIGSSSSIGAKNDNPFDGGTKKDVRVVSQADLDKISADLVQNLSSKAKDDMSKNLSGDKQLLPFFTKQDLTDKTFSNKLNEEAKSLTLSGTVHFESISIDKNDLASFAKEALKDKISQDETIPPDGITTDVTDVKQNSANISAKLTINAHVIPVLNLTDIEKNIAGKSFTDATTLIKAISQVQDVQIALNPPLPFLPHALPRFSNHIKVLVKTNE